MPGIEQLRERLLKKLSELFQLDQPDLDFGFYRIMHAKAREVRDFIGNDLMNIVTDAFGTMDDERRARLQAAYDAARRTAEDFGAPDPEKTRPVQKAKAALEMVLDIARAEADVYDHLHRFFERYYDDGDFISRRYFARETPGKAAPFALPYNGEEVKLVWANMDQYYIKSAEHFSSFTFDLRQAKEVRASGPEWLETAEDAKKVHFQVVAATEGEHGNVKAADANKRFFLLHEGDPVALTESGELVVRFEYRPDPEKSGQEKTWREKRNAEAVETVLRTLASMAETAAHDSPLHDYLRLLRTPAPTDKDKDRPLLAKYVNQYTARNTMDYFIHKDLGGFLRRELDFYIKNEVMHLDDIENADAPFVESYLDKIRVIRKVAGKLIDFLAQLEEFQKKLWLKKKFVVETNYCITLDRVPEELYPEIAANAAQLDEWKALYSIEDIAAEIGIPGYSLPLTAEFLKAHDKLMLDTRFFDEDFKARLVASIENFDDQCDGLLIHSENFQALNLLRERYREQVKCVYIDPPYNTGGDGFLYRDQYQHSCWLTMIGASANIARCLMNNACSMTISIDEGECDRARNLLKTIFGESNFVTSIIWQKKYAPANDAKWFSEDHDYLFVFAKQRGLWFPKGLPRSNKQDSAYKNPDNDRRGRWRTDNYVSNKNRFERPNSWYQIIQPNTGKEIWPSADAVWRYSKEMHERNVRENRIWWGKDGLNKVPAYKRFLSEVGNIRPKTIWQHTEVGHNQDGVRENQELFGIKSFSSPKPLRLLERILKINETSQTLDYFAGSGTTAHAVINLNREDGSNRKYILVEMGDHFDTVLKPRIAKVVYSDHWKDGKPADRHTGVSHCVKYIRLESYEDTLNNLRFCEEAKENWIRRHAETRRKTLEKNASLREDYMLRYLLDVETRGSQSLLNIDRFTDPWAYTLRVKKPGGDESAARTVDLVETFNFLIGLRVTRMHAPEWYDAEFERTDDPEVPEEQKTKLIVSGKIRRIENPPSEERSHYWRFQKIEGWRPADPLNPNNGQRENVLVIWRTLPAFAQLREEGHFAGLQGMEGDNLMLDEWFRENRIDGPDDAFDAVYVNGSNNLTGPRRNVRLIEEAFMKGMWELEG